MGGGFSSTALLPRVLLSVYAKEDIEFFTCVLPNEHLSMWRLFDAVESTLNITVTYITYDPDSKYRIIDKTERTNEDGLYTPFDIFDKVKFLGNTRVDPCSRMLKRETAKAYIQDKYPNPTSCVLAVGITEDEIERTLNIQENWKSAGYEVMFPLSGLDLTMIDKNEKLLEWYNVIMPLYLLGFDHNNCAGACVKAGQRQWAKLWYYFPHVYAKWEEREQRWRDENGEYAFLRMTVDGKLNYISLKDFRKKYLEPAACSQSSSTFINNYVQNLPGNPPCMWCAAI